MCGIVGYIGGRSAVEILLDGLRRLDYRGYDSAGVAVLGPPGLQVRGSVGKMKGLEGMAGTVGLGHTHWATRGRPCTENAHPHTDCRGALLRAGQKSALEVKVALVTQEISA